MTDSDRLNARLEQAARRKAEAWAPSLGPEIRRAVNELARRNVSDPANFKPATDADMDAMRGLKQVFLADERFNPCKAFPTSKGCGEVHSAAIQRFGADAAI